MILFESCSANLSGLLESVGLTSVGTCMLGVLPLAAFAKLIAGLIVANVDGLLVLDVAALSVGLCGVRPSCSDPARELVRDMEGNAKRPSRSFSIRSETSRSREDTSTGLWYTSHKNLQMRVLCVRCGTKGADARIDDSSTRFGRSGW